jgi:ribosomal-protein-alanine N-acetyltransferase
VEVIRTDRLDLTPLNLDQLRAYMEHTEQLERDLPFPVSRSILTARVRRAIRMKLARMEAAEERDHVWLTYWLIAIRSLPFGAGLAGFKGVPDPDGEAEIGYGIDPGYQGRGYMTEAVRAMIRWAFGERACRSVVALGVDKANPASRRVLEKAGLNVFTESEGEISYRIRRGDTTPADEGRGFPGPSGYSKG